MSAPAPPRPRAADRPAPGGALRGLLRGLPGPLGVAAAVLLAGAAVGTAVQGTAWFGHALLAVAVVVVTGVVLLRTRSWLVAPGQLVALVLLVTASFTEGAVLGALPGPAAVGELRLLLAGAGEQIDAGIPPVPASPEILLLVTLSFGVLAIAVFGLAVTVGAPAAAGVPLLCVFAVPTALDDQLLPWWSMVAAAAGFGVLLVARGDRLRQAPGGIAIAAIAVIGALLLGTAATAVGTAGRFEAGADGANSDGAIGLNPFTSLRGQLTRSEPRDLFRVSGLEQPVYLRALTLQRYVPQSGWVAGRPQPGVPLAGPLPPSTAGPARDATAQVANLGFEDYWLPVFGDPVSITGPSETDWSYDAAGGIAYSETPRQEDGWTQRMRLPDPSAAALRAATGGAGSASAGASAAATPDPAYLDTDGLDPRVAAISRRVTAQATTPFDRAMALNEYFSGPGSRFRYSLATAPGGGGDALVDFLTRGRTGYCEQFASAMAVMLRAVDVPARVAVGFTAGTPGPDGRTVTTNDAHAWVEAWFPGYGWQTFDPTPLADGRTVEPQYVQQARAEAGGQPAPQGAAGTPPPPALRPAPPTPEAAPAPAEPPPGAEAPAATRAGPGLPAVLTLLAVVLALALLGALPLLLRRHQRRRRTALARAGGEGAATAAWQEVLAVSRDHGVAPRPGDTVRAAAEHIGDAHGLDETARRSLSALTERVEASWYGGTPPGPGTLDVLVDAVGTGITAHGTPLAARLLPRSVLPVPRPGRSTEPAGSAS